MADSGVVKVTGLEDAKKFLRELPAALVRECFPEALAAGAAVIENELAIRTPRAEGETTSAKKYGRLIDDLGTTVETDVSRLTGNARIGFGDDGFPARMLEYGHAQVTHDGQGVGHVPAHPFIRPAADTAEDAAVGAFVNSVNQHLKGDQ